ncbi:hypothetical protein [Microvirga sp. G4-2]|uniref:hypothetical protein n=1 Tax=Microvirga sp. G4-2 TaxID=3434467 RepID=UPI00404474DC
MNLDRAEFFRSVRASLFGGRLTETQVRGMEAMLDAAPARFAPEPLAYCLATAFHETDATMQPVTENLNYSSVARIRAVWPSRFPSDASARPYVRNPQALANRVYGGRMGNVGADDGWLYRGRGLVQITGRENYARASRILGIDLLTRPDLATDPKIAALILYCGMADGWFTGKKLSDYFGPGLEDPYNARRIVNGLDRAADVAVYYRKFLAALRAATPVEKPESIPVADAHPVPPPPDIEPIPEPVKTGWLYAGLKALLEALFGRKA